ncbi:MAG TPA: hypothetical protein VGX94_14125 [Terriglobia bacterium]|nr:hypothetical protein [Terriglobia bacterium]
MSIWQAMARMTSDDWADKELFVYRLTPRTVNRETGDHNYIEKRVEPIDENTIKAMFGGGTFQLILNANTPRRRTVYKATAKIAGKPIFLKDEVTVTKEDPAENPSPAPAGASVEDMIKFARAMKEMGPSEKSDTAQDAMVAALNLVAQGAQKGMEITAAQAQKSGMSVDKLFELALQMREKQDPTMKALVEAMLQRLINSPESKAPSLKEKLEELKLIQEQIGANGGKSDSGWSFIAQAAAKAAESLPQLIQAIRERNAPMIVRAQPQMAPAMLPPGPRIQPPFQPQTVQAIDPVVLVKAKVIRSFVDGDNGQFVAWMLEKEAPPIFQSLKGKTVNEVKTYLSADAALREMIGQEGLEEFIGEILEYASTTEAPAESVQ